MEHYKQYIPFIIFLIVAYLCFLIAKPFIAAIFTGIILAYLFYPLYKVLCKKIKRENLCAVLVTILVLFLLLVPSILIVEKMTNETVIVYNYVRSRDFILLLSDYLPQSGMDYVKQAIDRGLLYILTAGSDFVLTIPKFLLNFFVAMFVMYFVLIDGHRLIEKIKDILPMDGKMKQQILTRFEKTTDALMYGNLVVAIVQGVLALIGFLIFGISGAFLWALITMVVSFLPVLGTAIVWLPLGLVELSMGNMFAGVGIIIYGALVIGTVDNILRPKLVSIKTDIHPAIILIGVLGGVSLIGFIGFIVGPLIIALLLEFLDIYGGHGETKS